VLARRCKINSLPVQVIDLVEELVLSHGEACLCSATCSVLYRCWLCRLFDGNDHIKFGGCPLRLLLARLVLAPLT